MNQTTFARPALLIVALTFAAPAASQDSPPPEIRPRPPGTLEMGAVSNLPQDGTGTRVGNAEEVNPRDWPATFRANFTVGGRDYTCSSTLLGPQALLTAAHCVGSDGKVVLVRLRAGGAEQVEARCTIHPAYLNGDASADVAMCLPASPVSAAHYENISVEPLPRGAAVRLMGLGCTGDGQPADGKLRIGSTTLLRLPGEVRLSGGSVHWAETPPGRQTGVGYLCRGDSGGPTLHEAVSGRPVIRAVNSAAYPDTGTSYVTALWSPPIRAFVLEWAQDNRQPLCGVPGNATGCRR
ncbi:MAG: S1 family peptidase [Roseomonas sp.]|nr:S1 family peptidase [Roseomonas sp.]